MNSPKTSLDLEIPTSYADIVYEDPLTGSVTIKEEIQNDSTFCDDIFVAEEDFGEDSLNCTVCKKTFQKRGALKTHMNKHLGIKPYECTICQKTFLRPQDHKRHMLQHTGEPENECHICHKSFGKKSGLISHMKSHPEQVHECDVCLKTFEQIDDYKQHMILHNGKPPYECPICKRQSNDFTNHKRHLLTHCVENVISNDFTKNKEPTKPLSTEKSTNLCDTYYPRSLTFEKALIVEIKKYPVLYNVRLKDYRDKQKKETIWNIISQKFGMEVKIVQNKWKLLRDNFARNKRRSMCGINKKKREWPLMPDLRFLDEIDSSHLFWQNTWQEELGAESLDNLTDLMEGIEPTCKIESMADVSQSTPDPLAVECKVDEPSNNSNPTEEVIPVENKVKVINSSLPQKVTISSSTRLQTYLNFLYVELHNQPDDIITQFIDANHKLLREIKK